MLFSPTSAQSVIKPAISIWWLAKKLRNRLRPGFEPGTQTGRGFDNITFLFVFFITINGTAIIIGFGFVAERWLQKSYPDLVGDPSPNTPEPRTKIISKQKQPTKGGGFKPSLRIPTNSSSLFYWLGVSLKNFLSDGVFERTKDSFLYEVQFKRLLLWRTW